MIRFIKCQILVLLIIISGAMGTNILYGQCAQLQIAKVPEATNLTVYSVSDMDVSTLPCTFYSPGSQITIRWPAEMGANPVSSITFNGNALGFVHNTALGPTGAIGSDGGDGYYYVQFINSTTGQQTLSTTANLELFNFDFVSSSTPLFEFVASGTSVPNFPNVDPAIFMGGQNVFTGFIATGAFPVEWTHFDAEQINGKEVELSWGTSLEINNDYFQIEKSVDGQVFETIGIVEGIGNTNQTQEYSFLDKQYIADVVYYRLKQVDINGQFEYSNTEEVRFDKSLFSKLYFEISPNPAFEDVSFKYLGRQEGVYQLIVVDGFGKQVLDEKFDLGLGVYKMPVQHLSEGMYYVSMISSEGVHYSVGRFLKQ